MTTRREGELLGGFWKSPTQLYGYRVIAWSGQVFPHMLIQNWSKPWRSLLCLMPVRNCSCGRSRNDDVHCHPGRHQPHSWRQAQAGKLCQHHTHLHAYPPHERAQHRRANTPTRLFTPFLFQTKKPAKTASLSLAGPQVLNRNTQPWVEKRNSISCRRHNSLLKPLIMIPTMLSRSITSLLPPLAPTRS